MAYTAPDPAAPDFVRHFINLADAQLGARVLAVSDEFFAAAERMLNPEPAVFIPGKYDAHGKWMDGWESRRKRVAGHDWCIVKLARPGWLKGVELDTSHFTGNYPPAASVEACDVEGEPHAGTTWRPLLASVNLQGNHRHYHAIDDTQRVSHVRVNLYPDGGLARLRLYGRPDSACVVADEDGRIDLIAALNGGTVIAANNEHFGPAARLLLPGRGVNMGDGWETRRRREPGNDWCIIALAQPGVVERVEVDTAHFKGNFPDRCSLQAAHLSGGTPTSLITQSMFWPSLMDAQPLQMDHVHAFQSELQAHAPITHVRFNIHPDGGVSRLRLWGRVVSP
ncbi:MAG: allantoicase [Lysobacteraceae bacterium]